MSHSSGRCSIMVLSQQQPIFCGGKQREPSACSVFPTAQPLLSLQLPFLGPVHQKRDAGRQAPVLGMRTSLLPLAQRTVLAVIGLQPKANARTQSWKRWAIAQPSSQCVPLEGGEMTDGQSGAEPGLTRFYCDFRAQYFVLSLTYSFFHAFIEYLLYAIRFTKQPLGYEDEQNIQVANDIVWGNHTMTHLQLVHVLLSQRAVQGVVGEEVRTSSASVGKIGIIEGTFTKNRFLMQSVHEDIVWQRKKRRAFPCYLEGGEERVTVTREQHPKDCGLLL